jgi:glucose/arabinose dehydrogenase
VVDRAELDLSQAQQPRLLNRQRIWTQQPKVKGNKHFAYRLLFDRDGKLWISSGERQQLNPAQNLQNHLGKIDTTQCRWYVPTDNPLYAQGGVAAQLWSWGHRNPLGIAFDAKGNFGKWKWGQKVVMN